MITQLLSRFLISSAATPLTGDETDITKWFIILGVAALLIAAAVVLVIMRRRKRPDAGAPDPGNVEGGGPADTTSDQN